MKKSTLAVAALLTVISTGSFAFTNENPAKIPAPNAATTDTNATTDNNAAIDNNASANMDINASANTDTNASANTQEDNKK